MADPRMTWTPGALSHDLGGRDQRWGDGDPRQPSGVRWSPVMREAAMAIMALPVPRRDEPGAVHGELVDRGGGRTEPRARSG